LPFRHRAEGLAGIRSQRIALFALNFGHALRFLRLSFALWDEDNILAEKSN